MLNRYFLSDVEINGSRSHFNVHLITLKGRKSKVYPIYYKRIVLCVSFQLTMLSHVTAAQEFRYNC